MEKTSVFRVITVSAVAFFVILLSALVINLVRLGNLNSRKEELSARLSSINSQIEQASGEIDYITTDEYIDQYAREYLNMQGADDEAFTGKEN